MAIIPMNDPFHIEMRRRMNHIYFEQGGKARKALYSQLRKHGVTDHEFFHGEELTIEEKIERIRAYYKAIKHQNKINLSL